MLHLVVALSILCTFQSAESLQTRDGNDTNSSSTTSTPLLFSLHPVILTVVRPPPRNFSLGVAIVVALNIRGDIRSRLISVISQELLNPQIDGLNAYSDILNKHAWVETTPDLRDLVNKSRLDIEDLKRLINVHTCRLRYVPVASRDVTFLVYRLSYLYSRANCVHLDYGCAILHAQFSTSPEPTPQAGLNVSTTAGASRRNHRLIRNVEGP